MRGHQTGKKFRKKNRQFQLTRVNFKNTMLKIKVESQIKRIVKIVTGI